MTPEEQAKELLPCNLECGEVWDKPDDVHVEDCVARYRPAVAAALEAASLKGPMCTHDFLAIEVRDLRAENDALRKDNQDLIEGIDGMIADREYFEKLAKEQTEGGLGMENDQLRAENAALRARVAQLEQTLIDVQNYATKQLAAARVDGLRWCRDLANVRLPYHEALIAEIDAEIAALERGK